jgi:hypothetical protein
MHDTDKNKRKKILKKLYHMQMGGYNFGKDLLNIPLYAGASYANGLQMGKSLDYDVESQKDLGNMAAINSGMNSLATLLNNRSRAKEERERLNRKQDENYYNTPQDRYRYADYSNSPNQASYFQKGGINRGYTNQRDDDYLYNEYRKALPGGIGVNNNDDVYNLRAAYKANTAPFLVPHTNSYEYHMPSRNPNTGEYLKNPNHPTYMKGVEADIKLGYTPNINLRTGTMSSNKLQNGGQIPVSNAGLYEYPGQPVMVPSNDITMEDIDYNVLAVPDNDEPVIMTPDKKYKFKNSNVVMEYPLL